TENTKKREGLLFIPFVTLRAFPPSLDVHHKPSYVLKNPYVCSISGGMESSTKRNENISWELMELCKNQSIKF
ncbi:MAG TPA: hypothetical protein PLP72_09245, partial [Leptospiraceae bacterium]|nr:hypothetical protein [Leptospiraceae bacterium]